MVAQRPNSRIWRGISAVIIMTILASVLIAVANWHLVSVLQGLRNTYGLWRYAVALSYLPTFIVLGLLGFGAGYSRWMQWRTVFYGYVGYYLITMAFYIPFVVTKLQAAKVEEELAGYSIWSEGRVFIYNLIAIGLAAGLIKICFAGGKKLRLAFGHRKERNAINPE